MVTTVIVRTRSGMGLRRSQRCDKIGKLAKATVHDSLAVLQVVSVTSALNYAEQHTRGGGCTGWQSSSHVIKKKKNRFLNLTAVFC